MAFRLITLLALTCLIACSPTGDNSKRDAYMSISGQTVAIKTDRGLCTDSCNQDFSRCMDQRGADDNGGVHAPRGMFGASADCRSDLKSCLQTCKSR